MSALLDRLRIQSKMILSFGIVTVAMLAIAAVALSGATRLHSLFSEYRETARQSLLTNAMLEDMLEGRLAVFKYRIAQDEAQVAEVIDNIEEVIAAEAQFAELGLSAENAALLSTVIDAATEYKDVFQRAVALQAERNVLVADLDAAGPATRTALSEIRISAYDDQDIDASNYAGAAQEPFLLARLYANRFLLNNETEAAERALIELEKTRAQLDELDASLQNPERRLLLEEVRGGLNTYRTTFQSIVETINARNALLIDRLDVIGPQANGAIDEVTDATVDRQNQLGPQAEARAGEIEVQIALMVVVAFVVGAVVAIAISRNLTRSVKSITESTQGLADGNLQVQIDGQERRDEIGDISRALQVFKENMEARERMEAEEAARLEAQGEKAKRLGQATEEFESTVQSIMETVASASVELESTANNLTHIARETADKAASVAGQANAATQNVQSVSQVGKEMVVSTNEINDRMAESTQISEAAARQAADAAKLVTGLTEASEKISEIIGLITDIAEKTNMLALNATIEAARAGEAGKGFAVVASEVKSLASQTAQATDEITSQVRVIQDATKMAADGILGIGTTIEQVEDASATVTSALKTQLGRINEIAASATQAAESTDLASEGVTTIRSATTETSGSAEELQGASQMLAKDGERLKTTIEAFLEEVQSIVGDRRLFQRHDLEHPCQIAHADQRHDVTLLDISRGGIALEGLPAFAPGTPVTVFLPPNDMPVETTVVDTGPVSRLKNDRPIDDHEVETARDAARHRVTRTAAE